MVYATRTASNIEAVLAEAREHGRQIIGEMYLMYDHGDHHFQDGTTTRSRMVRTVDDYMGLRDQRIIKAFLEGIIDGITTRR